MKSLAYLFAVIASVCLQLPVFAADPAEGPDKAAEKFFAGYVAQVEGNKDTKAWVAKSKAVTKNFKKDFVKKMSAEEVEADPVILAQDTPTAPFKAGKPSIKDTKATVVLTAKFGGDAHKVSVQMALTDGNWLVDVVSPAQ